jgi:hypothetical protein
MSALNSMKESPSSEPKVSRVEAFALAAPQYLGSPFSLILHTFFFVGIFVQVHVFSDDFAVFLKVEKIFSIST